MWPIVILSPSIWGPLRRQGLCGHFALLGPREGRGHVAVGAAMQISCTKVCASCYISHSFA